MAIVDTIIEGNIWQSVATIKDDTGTLTDPTTAKLIYILNSDPTTKVTLTYASATTPAPGIIAKTGVGIRVSQVDLTGLSGTLERYWQTTGTAQAVSETDSIIIPALPF